MDELIMIFRTKISNLRAAAWSDWEEIPEQRTGAVQQTRLSNLKANRKKSPDFHFEMSAVTEKKNIQ